MVGRLVPHRTACIASHTKEHRVSRRQRGGNSMHQSPRTRRLRNDLLALHHLRQESSVFRFSAKGDPPNHYVISLKGKGLWRDRGKVRTHEVHRIEIKLGASYPRTMPELRWMTPIYHPNISEIGMVCLGGYGTHWVPSVQLDELCTMLWDMARYHNYDIRSPYNREAALWVANQTTYLFPTDDRPLRDLRAAQGRISSEDEPEPAGSWPSVDFTNPAKAAQVGRSRAVVSDPGVQGAVAHVREFVDRYGQVFGGARASARDRGAREPVDVAPPPPAPAQSLLPMAAPADSLPAGVPPEPGDGVLILESSQPQEPRPGPRGEDILFIE